MNKEADKRKTASPPRLGHQPFVGIHLSGANTPKTAVVILSLNPEHRLVVKGVYEKIASYGSIFSDERLVDIIGLQGPVTSVFIDAPLTSTPCDMCVRPVCPGPLRCEDLAVAYMLKLNQESKRAGRRRKRPINPQSQRLWDVAYSQEKTYEGVEASFCTNKFPVVARARALARRLQALSPRVALKETSVPHTLASFAASCQDLQQACRKYRNFEAGLKYRQDIVASFVKRGWLEGGLTTKKSPGLYESLEVFHAFIAALVAYMHSCQLTCEPPDRVYDEQGWVYIPSSWQQTAISSP